MSAKNFLVLDGSLGDLGEGSEVTVGGSEGHHAARVMRVRYGETVLLTDTEGHQAPAVVRAVGKGEFCARLAEVPLASLPRTPQLTLIQALAKGGRDEAAIEFATELGVDEVIPWQADRSVVQWTGPKAEKGREKWISTVHAAVKQSRRPSIPRVGEVLTTGQVAAWVEESTADGCRVFLLHESARQGMSAALAELGSQSQAQTPERVALIVGPEGGVSATEVDRLRGAGSQAVRLGTEILRASSAGPAALAALCATLGRW